MSTTSSSQALAISDLQIEVATALRDFYNFLPWLQPDDVLEPPEQGWPNINTDNFAAFHKNDAVIELLKHLPYMRMDGPGGDHEFAFSTWVCDYRRKYFQEVGPEIDCWEIPDTTERSFTFPEWVVPLTYGKINGSYIMLDTSDGTAMRYEANWLRDPVYEDDDPRAWRNECDNPGSTDRLSDILNAWKKDYVDMWYIGQPTVYELRLHTKSSDETYKELRELMLRYGWPDNFDREGCRDAMLEWGEEKTRKDIDEMKQRHQLALNT